MPPRRTPSTPFKGKQVLITGGLGFIGSNLARSLVGQEASVTLGKLADLLVSLQKGASYTVRAFRGERRKIDIGDFFSDYRRGTQNLGWRPLVPLAEALSRTLDFYRKNLRHYV